MAYSTKIGATVKRKEDPRLITGAGAYVGDLKLPGMHHVAFVRSPYAHADIGSIDSTAALARAGVVAVVTGEELAQYCGPLPFGAGSEGGGGKTEQRPNGHYPLSIGRVRHVGEAVAAVIATTQEIAVDGVADVVVDWQPLPVIVDMHAAVEPDAPKLFDHLESNVDHVWTRKHGNAAEAFANAHTVVRQRMNNQRVAGISMEGRAVAAAIDSVTGGLTIWTSTQAAHWIRRDVAKALGLSENQVRAIAPDVGGGFGIKIGVYPEDLAVAAMARQYRMPLRWVETRIEHMVATTHGRAQVAEYEAAVQADGTITGLRIRIVADLGAYPVAADIPDLTGAMAVGVYNIPAVDIAITCVFTNTTPVAAYRGAGRPEAAYYIERLMDRIALEMQIEPTELRRKNFIPPEAFPYKTPTGLQYDSGEYARALDKALEISHYADLRAEQAQRRASGASHQLGVGLASYVEICGFGPYESAQVRVEPTGTVTVYTGISPHGQGTGTTFAQIVADQLGADFDKVVVKWGDTDNTPMGNGTMGSRSLAVGGGALVKAIEVLRKKASAIAAHLLEAAPEDIVLDQGKYQVKGVPERGISLTEIAEKAYTDSLPDEIDPGLESTGFFKPADTIFPFGAHVAVVEVETETGIVTVRDIFSVDDCGPRISPMLVTGQVHGGLAQGIAQSMLEEVVYDSNGQIMSGSLMDYAIPRADDLPNFVTDKTETPSPLNPLGVKGIGEAATIGSTPALTNAVVDALNHLGVRHLDMPLRAERIWRALQG
jgi:carbon-monoxide dehydrogenase large subunit